MFIQRLRNRVTRVYICHSDCPSGLRHCGHSHEIVCLILAPFEANSGGPVQQSVILLELTNVVFKASHVPLWVMAPHYVSQPKQRVVEKKNSFFMVFYFYLFFLTLSVRGKRAPRINWFLRSRT